MSEKRTSVRSRKADTPHNPKDREATLSSWDSAVAHCGVAQLRAKRGRPPKAPHERKEQIALRVDADVVAWHRDQDEGWQTRMNAVFKTTP
jgi:uncharacterized protein (DUF4415 family)